MCNLIGQKCIVYWPVYYIHRKLKHLLFLSNGATWGELLAFNLFNNFGWEEMESKLECQKRQGLHFFDIKFSFKMQFN